MTKSVSQIKNEKTPTKLSGEVNRDQMIKMAIEESSYDQSLNLPISGRNMVQDSLEEQIIF